MASRRPSAPRPIPRNPPAAESFNRLVYVDSLPRGRKCSSAGLWWSAPVSIPNVPIGSHVIRLELPDHRPWTASRQVTAGREERVTGSLDRIR